MKISVSNIAWKKGEKDRALEILNAADIHALDIAPPLVLDAPQDATPAEIEAVRNEYAAQGFDLVAMQSLLYGGPQGTIFESDVIRLRMLDHLNKVFAIGDILGARKVVFGSPGSRVHQLDEVDAEQIAIDFFTRVSEVAAKHDCLVCFEANPTAYGCGFITDTRSAINFIEKVNHPCFKLNLDTGTLLMNSEPLLETVQAAARHIGHIHVSAPHLGSIEQMPHEAIIPVLHSLDYNGYVSLEMKRSDRESLDEFRSSVNVFRKYYG